MYKRQGCVWDGYASVEALKKDFAAFKELKANFQASEENAAKLAATIEAMEAQREKAEKDAFEAEKKSYLDDLFKDQKITKAKYDKLSKYGPAEYKVFKEVFDANSDMAAPPKTKGTVEEGKVIDLETMAKAMGDNPTIEDFNREVR